MAGEKDKKKLAVKLKSLLDGVYKLTDDKGVEISSIFQILPDRKLLDYFKIIRNPCSLNIVKKKLAKAGYSDPQQFINHLVQIAWNARTYNVRGSYIYDAAVILDDYVKQTVIPKIKQDKSLPKHDLVFYPDLGPLPEAEGYEEPIVTGNSLQTNDEDADDFDHESNDDGDDDEDDPQSKKKVKVANAGNAKMDAWVKRGRPPVIDRPHEQRIKNIIRNLKKIKNPRDSSTLLFSPFDRLPDVRVYPDYYQHIQTPMAIESIRIKIKQRKYADVNAFIDDINLIINNCKLYNDPGSEIYQDCLLFESKVKKLIQEELNKPESTYLSNEAGQNKIPLDQLELNGKIYKIGDWVIINNPNDATKPTVAQIFRIWATDDNKRWVNVCWYYRPEQTVHRVDRLFYENEVCKTGQYRDHMAEEIIGKCYVMFSTRYQKGEPGVPFEGPFFLCEYRYNDENNAFNRIRTWKACLPDEVRDVEDPIIPLSAQRRLQRFESPIKHMLPASASMDMTIPQPTIGAPNAPPVVGAVYMRPPSADDDLGQYSTGPQAQKYMAKQASNSPAPQAFNNGIHSPAISSLNNSISVSRTNSTSQLSHPPIQSSDATSMYRNYQSSSYNKIHHATTVYSQPTSSAAFTLPADVEAQLRPIGGTLAKMDATNLYNKASSVGVNAQAVDFESGPLIWFRAPPVKLPARIQNTNIFDLKKIGDSRTKKRVASKVDDLDITDANEHIDGPGAGFAGLVGLGHSAEYIAWTIKRQKTEIQ